MSTRHGGVSPEPFGMNLSFNVGDKKENVEKNRELFFQALGIRSDRLAFPVQVHGNVVKHAETHLSYAECDGLITDTPELYIGISVADCVPIFIVETQRRVVAAFHAGWRGTLSMVALRGVEMMTKEFQCNPEHMVAYIGPSAGRCCYVVGSDVAEGFPREFRIEDSGRTFLDLKATNAAQLIEAGISRDAIEMSQHCTIGDTHLFHSYRRDKERSGRMMAVIGLRGERVR
jgi:YfiH family protein